MTMPFALKRMFAKRQTTPMKSVYVRVTYVYFVMIDMASHYIFAKRLTYGIIQELMSVINDMALVIGMPERFYYDSTHFATEAFARFCQIQDICCQQYSPNSNMLVQTLANSFMALVINTDYDETEINRRIWEFRSFPSFHPRTWDGITTSPIRNFYKRFEGDQIYRYAIQPCARSPLNSVGLAKIKYVRYPSLLKELEAHKNLKIRYVLLGSSNAMHLESDEPKDDIFKVVNFTNASIPGLSANRMNGKDKFFHYHLTQCDGINYLTDTDHHTIFILFIGANDYKNSEYDKYATSLLAAVSNLNNGKQKGKFITMTPLPRGLDLNIITRQMAFTDKLAKDMAQRQLRVVNTYHAIPHHLKSPSNLYCKKRNDNIHYSTEIRTVLSTIISNLIKLDIQQMWMDFKNPFEYSTV